MSQYFINIFSDFKAEDIPFLPAAAELYRERARNFTNLSPISHCLPEGMPMLEMAPAPYKIVQIAGVTFLLYERDTTYRQVYTDGRKLPEDPQPSWLGYSVGKWDGDSFVVDTSGFNDRGWLDARAHTHSEALHLTERFHRLDFGHMEVLLTIDDPKTYSRPFTDQAEAAPTSRQRSARILLRRKRKRCQPHGAQVASRLMLASLKNFSDFFLRNRAFADHPPVGFGHVDGRGARASDGPPVEYQIY